METMYDDIDDIDQINFEIHLTENDLDTDLGEIARLQQELITTKQYYDEALDSYKETANYMKYIQGLYNRLI